MTKKKINIFIGSLSGGGAERVSCNLGNYLDDKGFEVSIITMSDVTDTYKPNERINRVHLIKRTERKNKFLDTIIRYKNLRKFVMSHQNDLYIAMLPIPILLLMIFRKRIKGKIIISERNNPKSHRLYEKIIMKYSAKQCDGLVVQTTEISKWYDDSINKVVIPNAINKNFNNYMVEKKENKLVSVGRLVKQKNYPMLIDAFKTIVKKYPDYVLEIYGKGPEEKELKKIINNYNLSDKVLLKGFVDDISTNIQNAKAFIMTSNFEGMPNALIEAMCLGVPCISTDCDGGGAREIIENEVNGILIRKNDTNSLVKNCEKILNNPEYAKHLSINAQKLYDTLSYESIYGKWLDFIVSLK